MNTDDNLKQKIFGLLLDASVPDASGLAENIMEIVQDETVSEDNTGQKSTNPLTLVRWIPSKRNHFEIGGIIEA